MEVRLTPVIASHEDASPLAGLRRIEDGWNHEVTLRPIGMRGFLLYALPFSAAPPRTHTGMRRVHGRSEPAPAGVYLRIATDV